jgi:hypothetical protein
MLYTTETAAKELGCSARTVQRWAKRLKLGTRLGNIVALTPDDLRTIRPKLGNLGCPLMVPGNQLAAKSAGKSKSPRKLTVQSGDNRRKRKAKAATA